MFELVSSGASGVGQDKQIISDGNFDEIAHKRKTSEVANKLAEIVLRDAIICCETKNTFCQDSLV
jgi:hypothetical protein